MFNSLESEKSQCWWGHSSLSAFTKNFFDVTYKRGIFEIGDWRKNHKCLISRRKSDDENAWDKLVLNSSFT